MTIVSCCQTKGMARYECVRLSQSQMTFAIFRKLTAKNAKTAKFKRFSLRTSRSLRLEKGCLTLIAEGWLEAKRAGDSLEALIGGWQ